VNYQQQIFKIAKKNGLSPVKVATREDLRAEVVRKTFSQKEYRDKLQKMFSLFVSENFEEMLIKPLLEGLSEEIKEDGEDPGEIYEALCREKRANETNVFQEALSQVLNEEVDKIYNSF